jgi:hypothetical protein
VEEEEEEEVAGYSGEQVKRERGKGRGGRRRVVVHYAG